MEGSSSSQSIAMQVEIGKSYTIKPRTLVLREDDLVVQVKSPVDFIALVRHRVDVLNYLLTLGRILWSFEWSYV